MITESNSNFHKDFLCEKEIHLLETMRSCLYVYNSFSRAANHPNFVLSAFPKLFQTYSWLTPTSLKNSTLAKFALWNNKENCITKHTNYNCFGKLFFPWKEKVEKIQNRPGSFFFLQDCWKMPFGSTKELSTYSPGICIGLKILSEKEN